MASDNTFDQYEEQRSENKTKFLDQTKQNQCDDFYEDGTPVNKTSNPHKHDIVVIDEPAKKTGKL